ncbi:MAG TPA: prephenate dehydrogenase/arogenate dehydrogenase family protein [Erysipelotrichaceae bacterium]|nr:prephenate dehydrogenase/arogenate dehydrogenase family protein [Erysipelotrichaceae bacterium]
MISKAKKIAIVGLGLLGGSYAKGLARANYQLIGIDIDLEAVEFAKKLNWIVEGGDDPSLVKNADIIIFALYPLTLLDWVKENQKYFKSGAIITDVTGIKVEVLKGLKEILRDDVEFIASHPMAGKEVRGIKYADTSMFEPANYIIVPTKDNTEEGIRVATDIAKILNFNTIVELDPETHDEMVGFVSQLTHVIAVSLMNSKDNTHLVDYTGDSFRDLTRIAKINDVLWTELFMMNKENLSKEIDDFVEAILHFQKALDNSDIEEMKRLFVQSTERRKLFDVRK